MQLIENNKKLWTKSTSHRLTEELSVGELPLSTLYVYLKQDFKFFDHFLKILGKTISLNHQPDVNVLLGKQMGFVCSLENTYFENVLQELKTNHLSSLSFTEIDTMTLHSVQAYNTFMDELCLDPASTYDQLVTVLCVMEQCYLEWANKSLQVKPKDLPWWFDEWIELHSGEDFEQWCLLLRKEVDKCYKITSNRERMDAVFIKAVEYEIGFFDDCYDYKV